MEKEKPEFVYLDLSSKKNKLDETTFNEVKEYSVYTEKKDGRIAYKIQEENNERK